VSCVYRYSVEDSDSPVYTSRDSFISDVKYDLREHSADRWQLALAAAGVYFRRGGFRNRNWVTGKQSVKISIWLDNTNRYSYNVNCDGVPKYGSINVLA